MNRGNIYGPVLWFITQHTLPSIFYLSKGQLVFCVLYRPDLLGVCLLNHKGIYNNHGAWIIMSVDGFVVL